MTSGAQGAPSPGEWARIERLLEDALDLPEAERAAFLARACNGDAALERRVHALLDAASAADRFLERPAADWAGALVQELAEKGGAEAAAPPVERVGPYRLLREIGRGGMGAVYLAERDDDEYRRQVAVKLVAAAAPDVLTRFGAERQILASLEHPNIARLYDGGTAASGVPYLVMEYIAGERIDAWCDARRSTVADRLRLFETGCDAVAFAHRNLVVHRDLKPSNVLVADDGAVKLLDFGVAKLLEPDAAAASLPTRTGLRALTPEYASPELLRGDPVSTATDVYALGVLLYELLCGRRPYDLSGRSPVEMERILVDREPAPPSIAATPEAAERRGVSLDTLRRRLSGDLDNIVLTALRKEPERRYASVLHLRDDVRRHLDGLPVAARPATLRYRAGKFLVRHRLGTLAAALVVLSLGGGMAGATWQARTAAREAQRAERVRDFLVSVFENADPDAGGGHAVTAKELLDRSSQRLRAEAGLAAEPAIRAEMLRVVGRIYRVLGFYPEAVPLLEEALAGDRGLGRPDDVAESAGELASVLYEQGDYAQAEALAREVVELRRARERAAPAALASSLGELAAVLSTRGELAQADSIFREALAIDRRLDDTRGLAARLDAHSNVLRRATRFEEAKSTGEESLALLRALHGNEHTEVATALLHLASLHMEMGDFALAEQLLHECIAIREPLLGPDHPHVASAYSELGLVRERAGRLDAAEEAYRRALEIRRTALGDSHPDVAGTLNSLAVVQYFRARYADAAATFRQVVGRWRASYGPSHPNVLTVMNNLGAALREAGDYAAAERVLRETLAIRRETLGDEHPDVAQSYNNLGVLFARMGDVAQAEANSRQAIAIWRGTLGDDHPNLASGLVDLGRLLVDARRYPDAEPLLREGFAIRLAALAPEAPLLASARLYLAECLIGLGRPAEADTLLAAAVPVLRAQWGEEAEVTQRALRAVRRATAARTAR